ncbi:MAGUK p55 subfamily member 7 isoform X2 [Eurytemora carolleeae]|uniref:MAGUK p55 subfamily member 7 isoform X2 n=1 Tax=Eurytemora carolleeae TaxID=1294199 RepID=UPI000C75AD64|nr:MAGUK p55 subfamily member 7 isoform X2 [Eurytemora carolleeae]|eukprot:XP_023328596.1 MAGUK p55 subfamily member 7-like isoform X2 [Eurytemora affinis]
MSNNHSVYSVPAPTISHLMYAFEVSPSLPLIQDDDEEEYAFLRRLLHTRELHALVKAYDAILLTNAEIGPSLSNVKEICDEVLTDIRPYAVMNDEVNDLYTLLQSPFIQALIQTHDTIAKRDFVPKLTGIPLEVDEDEETIKIVQLVKSQDTLLGERNSEPIVGATIKAEEGTGRILIARVMHGGAADRSGLIAVGDEVIEVNNINVEGKTPNDVLKILQEAEHTITFKLVPSAGKPLLRESRVRLKALFDYNPYEDKYIPCKEAGLPFVKGDIIHIVSQDDPYWWQARREWDRSMRAGLIPSRALQERRIMHERSDKKDDAVKPMSLCGVEEDSGLSGDAYVCSSPSTPGCSSKSKTKKIMYDLTENEDFDREEIPTYEEVARLFPRAGRYRPIVIIGPPGVGRNELKRRLLALEPDRMKATVPHTSRTQKQGEVNGEDYFFCSRLQMQHDIDQGKFIEHGEFRGNLYGTSVDGVAELISAGYQPILTPHHQALKRLRTAELKPYIIYIKPPSFDVLKETRHQAYARSTFDESNSRSFTDEEFRDMITAGARIEYLYGHFADTVIVNDDLIGAFETLIRSIRRLDQDAFWVPASWVQ